MPTTSDWSKVKLDNGLVEAVVVDNEFELNFCIGDNQYSIQLESEHQCSEYTGSRCFLGNNRINIKQFNEFSNKQQYTSIEVEEGDQEWTIKFKNSLQTLEMTFYNDHNGHYTHVLDLYRNNERIYKSVL